ncbi:MAG: tetratricopeptide repeat protein [Steroidobacteraceae bacterium]|nr:tetratricopeptide repeat protein [Nevskiaceae bacterium]MCP5339526.1 tetratricopeptide repeat protein [Nevskiaceae bacterium]MCP5466416.1 tetratricopeptide repeat protein [Nevskiaceae bacterium]MCP5471883.1 tetratricopeptide repeat protein [Nevskiaceae bacterium]
MQKIESAHGLVYTCTNPEAVVALERTLRSYLAFDKATGSEMKAMLALDPTMPMARVIRGSFLMLMGVGVLVGRARAEAESLARDVAGLERREAMHVEALAAWSGGTLQKATALWTAIMLEWPRDILAIKLANFGSFYLGRSRQVRDGPAAVIDHWDRSDPEYSYLLSLHGFGLEECGDFGQAERLVREALAINPRDPWGVHGLAHVLEGTERVGEGIENVERLQPHWSEANNFRYHVAWHLALFHFEKGDLDGALDVYDRLVCSEKAVEYLDICNDASMLVRLEIAGVDVGARWKAVAEKVAARNVELVMAFPDVHFVLALASSGDAGHRSIAEALCAKMDEFARRMDCDDADAYRRAGAAIGRATLHYRDGRYAEAARLLIDVEPDLPIIGGSNAQRELFCELAAECLWRDAPAGVATGSYLASRTFRRPGDSRWWNRYLSNVGAGKQGRLLAAAQRRRTAST